MTHPKFSSLLTPHGAPNPQRPLKSQQKLLHYLPHSPACYDGLMRQVSRRSRFVRCHLIGGYFPALERIDTTLQIVFPELERAKIKRAMSLLFGEQPEITDFSNRLPSDPAP
jgi:hypothetical protein